jgi:prepilin-type N-terminal cleavage/methylation domain-containing protein
VVNFVQRSSSRFEQALARRLLKKEATRMTKTQVRQAREVGAGFTLIELMITVAIIGVLAILAGIGFSSYIRSSKTAEASAMIGAIKTAQETYRSDKLQYFNINSIGSAGGTMNGAYPNDYSPRAATGGVGYDQKVAWIPTGGCTGACLGFRRLGVVADSYVYYTYTVAAGLADGTPRNCAPPGGAPSIACSTGNDPWYFISAVGDLNGDGTLAQYVSSTVNTTLTVVNGSE